MHLEIIQNKILEIRSQKVMLDYDLARLYEVETKVFNQAVKRNINRFPEDFMFQLTENEWKYRRSPFATSSELNGQIEEMPDNQLEGNDLNRSQFVTGSSKHRNKTFLPYAFTEHGVTMLSSVYEVRKQSVWVFL